MNIKSLLLLFLTLPATIIAKTMGLPIIEIELCYQDEDGKWHQSIEKGFIRAYTARNRSCQWHFNHR
ncbi:hypothetical protein [Facilibium subflavum]|uniref:hypothetical protein n=1 Tax=Facilibium subflavum TaxID=2219058 RepID=UPI001AACBFD3|nr:hypothetical protein [Facilibium subflavum]